MQNFTTKSRQTDKFFEQVLSLVEEYADEPVAEQFKSLQAERERYLRERWADYGLVGEAIEPIYYRDIDYEHVVVLLHDHLTDKFDELFEASVAIIKLAMQYGEYEKARHLVSLLKIPAQDKQKQAEFFMLEGKLALLLNQYERSTQKYQQAAQLYSELDDKRKLAGAYNNLGIIAYEQWQTESGREYFEQARILGRNHGDENLAVIIQMNLGIVHLIQGEAVKAGKLFESLLGRIGADNKYQRLLLLANLGLAARDARTYSRAKQSLEEALKIAHELEDQHQIGIVTFDLAEVSVLSGEYDTGNELLLKAFTIFSNLHDAVRLADAYRVFGILHTRQGYYELAESEFRISLRVNKEKGNTLNLAETYQAYSELAAARGSTRNQIEYLRKALSFCQSMQAVRRIEQIRAKLESIENAGFDF
ncbi:MAG TPA: hypothetical protein VKA68_18415 [bacterium]|nr:hypothetical protein [bacterium]